MPTNSVPEGVPAHTYITVNPPEEDPKFLRDATRFHQVWRLNPIEVASFEQIIRDLARRKKNKKRIRIVAHAAFIGIKVPFFNNGPGELWDRHFLDAWARSDVMGLHHTEQRT